MKNEFEKRFYEYAVKLVKVLMALPQNLVSREVIRQVIRSGTSVSANYFEGQSASTKKDFQLYLTHSLKSAKETKFWLNILIDTEIVSSVKLPEVKDLLKETEEFIKMFTSSILTMKKNGLE